MSFAVETCIAQHVGDRAEQQDRVALFAHPQRRGLLLAALADGMGGHSGGAMAAEQVLLRAKQNFEAYAPIDETPEQLLGSIIDEAHLGIRLTRFTSEQDPHSTAAVLFLGQGRVSWAHCGDSRIYHCRGNAVLSRSADHSLVGELGRKGYLDEAGMRSHPQRNVLLSCLGSEQPPHIDHGRAEEPVVGDCFLLCSDGLWGFCSDAELAATLHELPPRAAAEHLVGMARGRARGGGDNISLAIVKLVESRSARHPRP